MEVTHLQFKMSDEMEYQETFENQPQPRNSNVNFLANLVSQ